MSTSHRKDVGRCAVQCELHHILQISCLLILQVPKQAAQETQEAAAAVPVKTSDPGGFDMFADGIDADMFSDAPALNAAVAPEKKALLDNYDDAEGYYNFQVPHIFQSTYIYMPQIFTMHNLLEIWVLLAMCTLL